MRTRQTSSSTSQGQGCAQGSAHVVQRGVKTRSSRLALGGRSQDQEGDTKTSGSPARLGWRVFLMGVGVGGAWGVRPRSGEGRLGQQGGAPARSPLDRSAPLEEEWVRGCVRLRAQTPAQTLLPTESIPIRPSIFPICR